MKRKIAMLILVLSLVVSATACGGNSEETDSPTQEPENKEEIVDVPDEPEESVYFKEDVLKIDMATIKLTGFEIAPPNQELGEEKSTLIITYEFTNDSDDVMQPGTRASMQHKKLKQLLIVSTLPWRHKMKSIPK